MKARMAKSIMTRLLRLLKLMGSAPVAAVIQSRFLATATELVRLSCGDRSILWTSPDCSIFNVNNYLSSNHHHHHEIPYPTAHANNSISRI